MKTFSKEEKGMIKAFVKLYLSKGYIDNEEDCSIIEKDTFQLLDRKTYEERFFIEDYAKECIIKELANKNKK